MRIAKMIEPRPVVKGIGLHNEDIPLPVTDRISQHSRIRIFRKFAPVGPDEPMDVMSIKQLNDAAGNLNEFDIAWIVFQKQQTRDSQGVAISHGIVPQCRRNCSRSVAGLVRVKPRLAFGSEWGSIVAER